MVSMYSFEKSLQKEERTRRYSIQSTASGWEVREEQDQKIVRQHCYQDWHRVERARSHFTMTLRVLCEDGWREL